MAICDKPSIFSSYPSTIQRCPASLGLSQLKEWQRSRADRPSHPRPQSKSRRLEWSRARTVSFRRRTPTLVFSGDLVRNGHYGRISWPPFRVLFLTHNFVNLPHTENLLGLLIIRFIKGNKKRCYHSMLSRL